MNPTRPIYVIANEISKNWDPVYFGAVPYLKAMNNLSDITDMHGMDTARSIITYFLGNAQTWRGETAKRIKKELNDMLKK